MVYKDLNGLRPKCISDLPLNHKAARHLRSSGTGLVIVPRIRTKQSKAFSFYAPQVWNKLPLMDSLCLLICRDAFVLF